MWDILNLDDDEEWAHKAILYRLWDKGIQCLMADIWADNNVAYLIGCYATAQDIAYALGVHQDVIYQADVVSSLTIINLYQEKCIRKNENTYTL